MGQLSEPHEDADDELGITVSGLPKDDDLDSPGLDGNPDEQDEAGGAGQVDEVDVHDVEFDLSDWSQIERDAVTEALVSEGVLHHWDGLTLVVTGADAAKAEDILDAADAAEELDPEIDQVAYDLTEWDDDQLISLGDALEEAEVDFAWDGDELFVYEHDEQRVDEIIDEVTHPHELASENDDGDAGAGLLGELFVAADRLQHDPDDHETCVTFIDLSRAAEKGAPPYGLARKEWDRIKARVSDLDALLRKPDADENIVLESARELRDTLRPYV